MYECKQRPLIVEYSFTTVVKMPIAIASSEHYCALLSTRDITTGPCLDNSFASTGPAASSTRKGDDLLPVASNLLLKTDLDQGNIDGILLRSG